MKSNPNNYDAWFDFVRLMESDSDDWQAIRDVYERAISNIPPVHVRFSGAKCVEFVKMFLIF